MADKITIKGAREHNLNNVSLEIPKNELVVFTGVSGSGKSSLAFDTIFAEGQRRYIESLSTYARQFLGQMDKPDVDYIDGLTLSGGCPMCNAKELIPFVKSFKKRFPRKTIWCYCGETVEEITEDPKSDKYQLLNLIDVLVDGQFVLEKKKPNLAFRGSSNQRIIKVTHKNEKVSYKDVSSTYSHDK